MTSSPHSGGAPPRAQRLALLALLALLDIGCLSTLVTAQPGVSPPEAAVDSNLARRLDPLVDAAVSDGFAGGVAVMRAGELVFDRVVGMSRRGVPVTEDTLFHVASISKYFTAVLVLTAAERGDLDLTSSVAGLAPGTELAKRGVTFEDLLAHRSGLGSSYVAESETDAGEALAAIDSAPFDSERVGSFRYSNDGYDLLAILLERVYGRGYEELMRELVLRPAGLAAPSFWAEVDLTDAAIVGQPLRSPGRRLRRRNYGMIGSAGLLIRAVDLVRFQAALAGGRVLAEESLAGLFAERGEVSIGQATFGAFLVDHPELGRGLSARGYEDWGDNAILNHYRKHDLIIAVVTSKGPAEKTGGEPFRTRLSREIEGALAQDLAK